MTSNQHPNLLGHHFFSPRIDRTRSIMTAKVNPAFYYGHLLLYDGRLYVIINDILLDDLLPVTLMIVLNVYLFYWLRGLSVMTSRKLSESIWILFFLTIFSVFVAPQSFFFLFYLYIEVRQLDLNDLLIPRFWKDWSCFRSCRNLWKKRSIYTVKPPETISTALWSSYFTFFFHWSLSIRMGLRETGKENLIILILFFRLKICVLRQRQQSTYKKIERLVFSTDASRTRCRTQSHPVSAMLIYKFSYPNSIWIECFDKWRRLLHLISIHAVMELIVLV